ncbi:MAG: sodium ion-translocating decarboxylase subunit beta, partial [Lutibacter sp.]
MKKILLIFGVLSLLIFIRPALGLNTAQTNPVSTTNIEQTARETNGSFIDNAIGGVKQFYKFTGFANATPGHLIMILIGIIFIYLGIKFDYEPLLLVPIGAGIII